MTIDGLRGIAALAVVVYHLHGAIIRNTPDWLPGWLDAIFQRGYLGVEVFFVVSGFVIAFSVREGPHTLAYFGRFALRRSIRLDPPYWLTLALEVTLVYVGLRLIPSLGTPLPTPEQFGAHLLYTQNLLGYGDILPIFWTLCYEVQFYVFFVGILVAWSAVRAYIPEPKRRAVLVTVLGGLFILSITTRFIPGSWGLRGLALHRWFQFFLGVLTYWVVARQCSAGWLYASWMVLISVVASPFAEWEQLAPVGVSVFVVGVAFRGRLGTSLGGSVLQYLGRQSYSLYLLHLPIGWRAVSALQMALGDQIAPITAWGVFAIGTAVSIVAADLMQRLVEKPTIAWSKRFSPPATVAIHSEPDSGGTVTAIHVAAGV